MKWKNRLTNYNFWISLVSAVLLILQAFNFEFNIAYISEIATAVLGLLVVIGIISDPTKISVDATVSTKTKKQEPVKEETAEAETTEEEKPSEQIEENKEPEDNYVVPNNDADENVVCSAESDFQTIINHITKEIEKATEKLKAENKEISTEIAEITNKIEQSKHIAEVEEVKETVKENALAIQTTENDPKETTVYNIVN